MSAIIPRMSDEQNNESQPPTETQASSEGVQVQPLPLPHEVQHVRLGGQAGVRVQQTGGLIQNTRVRGAQEAAPDCRLVPNAVLAEARELLDGRGGDGETSQLTAAERLQSVRDLLAPWL